jgi:transcriptional antiterminator RfaH
MANHWYLVQCKPRESFRAEEHLNNQGFETFHPTHLVHTRVAGRRVRKLAPLSAARRRLPGVAQGE